MKSFLRFFLLAAICLSPLALRATIMVPLAVEDISKRAELILQGTVMSKNCLKDPNGRIYTKIEFKVDEAWKGNLSTNFFVIVHGGGTVDGLTTVVGGQAEYEVGEEVVAFLRLNQRGEGVSIGLAQGKFRVWKDDVTGEMFAHNVFHGQPKELEPPPAAALRSTAGKPARLGLGELKRRAQEGTR